MDVENLSKLEKNIMILIEESEKNLTFRQIKRLLNINTEDEEKELESTLKNLETNGYLYLNDYDEYQLFSKCNELKIGQVRCNSKNKVYIVAGKKNIFIPDSHLNGAIAGDIVIIRQSNFKVQGNTRGVVDKVLKRTSGGIVFDYIDGKFKPLNWPVPIEVSIPKNQEEGLVDGSRVLIKLSLEKNNNAYNGQVVSLVGHKDDPQLDIKTIASTNGAVIDFSDEAMKEANSLNKYVTKEEIQERISKGGRDLRDKVIFTIDGEHTKDIDDAVSIEKKQNGNYLLGVHIADVSHYVHEDTILDLEARERSTSIYPYNCVIPMLPHILSNGICSLNPNEDRLALSWLIELTPDGKIADYEIVDSIIRSKKKLSYEKVNDIFERQIYHEDYEPYVHDLALMMELSEILNVQKENRGYLSFGDDDVEFEDDNGIPINIRKRRRGMAEKMIENFMLTANEITASYTYWINTPGIYRNHPAPNAESVKAIIEMLKLNIHIPQNLDNPRTLQNIIEKIQKFDENGIYSELLLQSMKRAYYSPKNIGHFGLALPNYTHCTSPIRRYPDLATHRIIRKTRDDILSIDSDLLLEKLDIITKNASLKERIADKIEKEANHYKMAEYMEQHIGETFTAYVSYISHNGLSIKTEELIFGKISMEELKNLGFKFNSEKACLENNEKDITIYMGDKISVYVKSASKETGKIKFEFIDKQVKNKTKELKAV